MSAQRGLNLVVFCMATLTPSALLRAFGEEPPDAASTLSAAEYTLALDRLAERLGEDDLTGARGEAAGLLGARVQFGGEALATDASVLGPAAAAKTRIDAARAAPRVRALARRLREVSGLPAGDTAGARPELLARLGKREEIEKGGHVAPYPLKPLSLPGQVLKALTDAAEWVADIVRRLRNWLARLWPKGRRERSGDFGTTTTAITLVVALVAAMGALLAYRTLRRSRGGAEPVESSALARSARDEDPLSREANEWERFARELAAAGRTREAIRAWYHAVLVTLFRAGTLHYERGRTNWEYVSRLRPELAWRPSFIDITRRFDQEWYGRDRASPEALRECIHIARTILHAVRGQESQESQGQESPA